MNSQGVINLNKDDFATVEDINEAIGAILTELSDGKSIESDINKICDEFYKVLKWYIIFFIVIEKKIFI